MIISWINILAVAFVVWGLIWSGILIRKFTRKYENMEIFWIVWIFVAVIVVGNKFI